MHQRCGNYLAIALALLNGDHAFGTAPVARIFSNGCAFAVTVLGGCQNALLLILCYQHGDDTLADIQRHAAHTTCIAAQRANVIFVKAHGLAAIAEQHHIVFAVCQSSADQIVTIIQVDGNDAALARIVELIQRCFFDRAH